MNTPNTKAGRPTDEAEQRIAAQAQEPSTCPVCKGARYLHEPTPHNCECDEHCSACGGEGTVSAGDLAQWREEAIKHRDRLLTFAYQDGSDDVVAVERDALEQTGDLLTAMIAHLAAMPQPNVNAELLGAAQELKLVAAMRGDSTLPSPPDDPNPNHSARMQTAWDEFSAAVEAAEKEAAG